MENNNKERKAAAQKAGSLLLAGCMFLGMAGGWYFQDIKIGLFAGMGVGLIMMAVTVLSASRK
ncbi:MAG: hypothetical protein AB1458_14400 [Bacteroidota bacterium]